MRINNDEGYVISCDYDEIKHASFQLYRVHPDGVI